MNQIFLVVAVFVLMGSMVGAGQFPIPGRAKVDPNQGAVARTEADLKRAERAERPAGAEKKRYVAAQKHLAEFERQMAKSRFKAELFDTAIADVESIVAGNRLSAEDREALTRDLAALRQVRTKRGIGY